jgi:putative phage-type endonuclease
MSESSTEIVQGSAEWLALRLGNATASRLGAIMAQGRKGEPSATRANLMAELVAERLTGVPYQGYKSAAMERGNEVEPAARGAYEARTGVLVATCGYYAHPSIARSGASPDGLVGDDGLLEIKCPGTAQHLRTLQGEAIATDYLRQMQWQMECTGRQWCDFVSFDDRLPPNLHLKIIRVDRDPMLIAEITRAVTAFLGELDQLEAELRGMSE